MKIEKLKGSLKATIPDDLAADLGLHEGDEVIVSRDDGNRLIIQKASELDIALAKLRELRRPLPADYKFDREEANARR